MDYVIRGGTVVDGTGSPAFTADIGIRDGKIAAVGARIDAAGATVIDAAGHLVTPGFIDIHTHYDGQATWDSAMEPSSSHGVTTLIMGNCGVGFAPMRAADRDTLIDLMEGVEDIPGTALSEGMPIGKWETFPEFLDYLDSREFALDVGGYIPHGPLRFYVMGERGARDEDATAEDIAEMARLTREAVAAGAVGLSTSRTVFHRSRQNDTPVPGTYASKTELLALAQAVADSGKGIVQVIPAGTVGDGGGALVEASGTREEVAMFAEISRQTGVPVTFSLAQLPNDPTCWRDALDLSAQANITGANLRPQIAPRSVTILQGLSIYHYFQFRPSYQAIAHLPLADRVAAMRRPEVKRAILDELDAPMPTLMQALMYFYKLGMERPGMYLMGNPVDYEPCSDKGVSALIATSGEDPQSFLYDLLVDHDGKDIYMHLLANYVDGNLDACHDMLTDPNAIVGLGDGGAHANFICDASNTTFLLSHWARHRTRGAKLPVEQVVAKLTSDPADFYELADRGRIVPGLRADLNVINLDRLAVMPPVLVQDLPAGGVRLLQEASGYRATFVNGRLTRQDGIDTGERPGRLVRSSSAAQPAQS